MRKSLLVFLLMCASALGAKAGAGDTTWVSVFTGDSLTHYGAFDKPANFPNGSLTYRKIYMVFTMGEYACPVGSQYCHQWDYTVENYVMTNTGDTFELSRFITPFATSGAPFYPSTWKHKYVFDVTDFYPVLKNSQTFRLFYSGYSWGFTADVKFAFVEGTPARNVLKIDRLWHGSWQYGNAANPISNNLQPLTRTAPTGTQSSEMKFTVTGHGSDAAGCCEFASHNYTVSANGSQIDQTTIWRDNCGFNEQFAQGGTWVYNRGNWCPGDEVNTNTHKLTGVTAGSTYTVAVDFDPYTSGGNYGSYTIEGAVMNYAGFNHTLDASLEDIIAPTNWEGHFRENPTASHPVVRVRNTGSTAITSIKFAYNVKDSTVAEYTWNGSLAPLADSTIELPPLSTFMTMSLNGVSGLFNFMVRIETVNGQADNDAHNDTLRSQFLSAPMWPKSFLVNMKTNGDAVGGGLSETSWIITDVYGNVVKSRTDAVPSTTYSDSVFILTKGVYKLTISDAGCDGLNWWASPPSGQGGTFSISKIGTIGTVPLTNYPTGQYNNDFGCGFTQYFTSQGLFAEGVENVNNINAAAEMIAYPNPAHGTVNININGLQDVKGTLQLVDAAGRVVLENKCTNAKQSFNIAGLADGVYMLIYNSENGKDAKLQTRLVITQ